MAERRRFPRWVRWTSLGCGVAVLAAGTYLVVGALPSSAATAGLRTTTVATGSVTQSISMSGSVERVDQVTATFRTAGTVTSVKVSVGDQVEVGDVLATIGTADLERAVTVAQAQLVSAQAALDAAASSSSTSPSTSAAATSSTTRSSASSTATRSSTPSPTPSASPTGRSGSGGGSGSARATTVDTTPVHRAVAGYDALVQAAVTTCGPVTDPGSTGNPTPAPSPNPSASPTPSATSSSTPSTDPTPSSSATPTPTPTPSDAVTRGSLRTSPAGLAPASQDGPTPQQVSACVQALSSALTSAQHTASDMNRLAQALDAAAKALQEQQSKAGSQGGGGQGSGSGGATGTGSGQGSGGATGTGSSKAAGSTGTGGAAGGTGGSGGGAQSQTQSTAGLQVAVLKATQTLAGAQQDLAAAVLRAPISGTVGKVALVKGEPASTSAGIVIVGAGAAAVTVDLPLAQLGKVRVDQDVVVTPAGTTEQVPGVVQSVGVLPTSTTSSTPTYPVRVTVSDAPVTLATGSTATATITLATATDVLTVPVSAITGVSSGSGTVSVLSKGVVTPTTVTVGAIGGGRVQVEEGLRAGQVVVLADPSTALPTNTLRFRRLTTGGVGGITGQGGPGAGPPPGG